MRAMFAAIRIGLALLLVVFWGASHARAEERLALVIGNSAYASVTALDNPDRDAQLIAQTLEQLGFTVTVETDLTQVGMKRAIAHFGRSLRAAGKMPPGCSITPGTGCKALATTTCCRSMLRWPMPRIWT